MTYNYKERISELSSKETDEWIGKAVKRPGRVRRMLGVKEGQDVPEKKLNKKITSLRKKARGEKRLSKEQRSELGALQLAKRFKSGEFKRR